MKKLYTEDKFKKLQEIKAKSSYKRKKKLLQKIQYDNNKHPQNNYTNNPYINHPKKPSRTLNAPTNFSLTGNPNETLKFFDKFLYLIEQGIDRFIIDMRTIQNLTIEPLLYLISLDKLFREEDTFILIKIKTPKNTKMKYLIAASGFTEYFSAKKEISLDEEYIFKICDGETNKKNNLDDAITCAQAVDFSKKFFTKEKTKDTRFLMLYEALAELMQNTDDHAYDFNAILDNWYLFAIRLEKGIGFYFFDNGRGIIKTAREKIIDKAYGVIGLKQSNIMKSVLNGEFRSRTKLSYRGKGLPQINKFLMDNSVSSPIIITNKIFFTKDENSDSVFYDNLNYNFKGSLFIWILKLEDE